MELAKETAQNDANRRAFLRGISEHAITARAWLFIVFLLSCGRVLWIALLNDYLSNESVAYDLPLALLQGLRTDSVVATYLLLPPLVLIFACYRFDWAYRWAATIRVATIGLFCLSLPALLFGSVGYFETFGDTYNIRVFDLFKGNLFHIIDISIKEYNLVLTVPISLLVSAVLFYAYVRFAHRPLAILRWSTLPRWTWQQQTAFGCGLVLCTLVLMRGSIGLRPMMHRDSCVTSQWVLNQSVLNPYFAMKCAWKEHRRMVNFEVGQRYLKAQTAETSAAVLASYIQDGSPSDATGGRGSIAQVAHVATAPAERFEVADLDMRHPMLKRIAAGTLNGKPSHVFVLFVESYDAWPFLDKYQPLHLVDEGRRLAEQGLHLKRFLPGANNSVDSFAITIQGLHETHKYKQQKLPTSLVHMFQQLGYKTRSINAFGMHAENGQKMISEQGFEQSYFTHDIKQGGETNHNTVHDRTLYQFIEHLPYENPTFSFIYPQSYHPPFDLDLEAENCVLPPYPESLKSDLNHDEQQRRVAYGHMKYSDRCLGEFVDHMSERFPRALFVITGDHFCRNPISKSMGLYERSAVPLILYGPDILRGRKFPHNAAGSHVDLAATVTELAAPAGFEYRALGQNLLKPRQNFVAVGTDYVLFQDSIVSLKGSGQCEPLPWISPISAYRPNEQRLLEARKLHNAFHGIGYLVAQRSLQQGLPTEDRIAAQPALRPASQRNTAGATLLR